MNRNIKIVAGFSTALVVGLTVVSFILSFSAIQQMAIDTGVAVGWLSMLVPVVIDGAMIVFSLSALRNSLVGESAKWDWVMIAIATVSSVAFNVLHAPQEPVSIAIAAMPPLFLFTSFERLMAQIKSMVKRNQATVSLNDLQSKIESATSALRDGQAKVDSLQASVSDMQSQCKQLESERKRLESECKRLESEAQSLGNGQVSDAQILALYSLLPKLSHGKAAEVLRVSRPAIGARLKALEEHKVIYRNGHGVEIL